MKNLLFLLLFLFSAACAWSQNIVPNPNFAVYDSCPNAVGQIDRCRYWHNFTNASPDYFNSCHDTLTGSTHIVGVPTNISGSQASRSNAYAGIATSTAYTVSPNYREYIASYIPPLVPGYFYRVLLRVSLGDNCMYGTNGIGVGFYMNEPADTGIQTYLSLTPQIDYSPMGDITDKVNWLTLIDTFVADSAYRIAVIGNFRHDSLTHKTTAGSGGGPYALYYVDSVSIERIGALSIPHTSKQVKATLYPNPFTDHAILDIENVSGSNNTLCIYNAQGALVRKIEHIDSPQITIVRDDLEQGFYYYKLRTDDNTVLWGRMAIQ